MLPTEVTAATGQASYGEQDLGPLAWVLEELRKSLDGAVKATRRFVLEAAEAGDSDLAALDSSPLRTAKQQLHQSCGALEMVGMSQAALLLRAMETALQHYVQNPGDCSEAVVHTLEQSSFALMEFLEAVLAGQQISSVALFPQYRDVQALYGNEGKVHPADLWPIERRLRDPQMPAAVEPLRFSAEHRQTLDSAVLQIVKGLDVAPACMHMRNACMGFAQAQADTPLRIFWKVAAGYFDAMAHGMLRADIYTKRVASRVLMVSAALAKGGPVAPERLLQDMLFFCAQATGAPEVCAQAVVWQAVHTAFGMQCHTAVDYEKTRFGRFDPTLLAQARKRIAAATEVWSALAGGDLQKIKPALDQFTLVCDSLTKLLPDSQRLAKALMQAVQHIAARGQPPSASIAMEVATAVLYLQAAFASLDMADEAMAAHGATLAQRLTAVLAGEPAQPLEPWMEQLYRQVSDQQTMGSVLGELRGTLAEAEKLLDQYFRNPSDRTMLPTVAIHLGQMRGVLSVLGLEPASQAMVRMRQNVEQLLQGDVAEAAQRELFEKMGNSLGALGFLIDMLSYQRHMARKLYEFDEEAGELKLLMGRVRVRASDAVAQQPVEAVVQARVAQIVQPVLLPQPALQSASEGLKAEAPQSPLPREEAAAASPAMLPPLAQEALRDVPPEPVAPPAPAVPPTGSPDLLLSQEDTDDELLSIFLEEAREVVGNGRAALQVLAQAPANLSEQTVLRRAFHTLKGSSRMVGLDEFGQAGWAMEQMLNAWLAEQKAMPKAMQALALQALAGFEAWVNAIEAKHHAAWQAAPFRISADAMRLENRWIPLDRAAVQAPPDVAETLSEASNAADVGQQSPQEDAPEAVALPVPDAQTPVATVGIEPAVAPDTVLLAPPPAQDIVLDELDVGLQAAGDGMAAPILPSADEGLGGETELVGESAESSALQDVVAEAAPQVQQVGDLSIPLPLFNVYMSEAETWSYRLHDALTAWQENLDEALPDMVVNWAHSLAGSSATVGLDVLSELARKLEHALSQRASQAPGNAQYAACLVAAAVDIRQMLQQCAAGVLPSASPATMAALQAMVDSEVGAAVADSSAVSRSERAELAPLAPLAEQPEPVAQGASAAVALEEDEIEAVDTVDSELFPIFEEEALELLPTMGTALRDWGTHPTRLEARHTLLRALHTLKGSARLAGAMRLGEMAHRLESALETLDLDTVTTEQIEPLFVRLDAIEADFHALRMAEKPQTEVVDVVDAVGIPSAAAAPAPLERPRAAAVKPAPVRSGTQHSVRVRAQLLDRLINESGEVLIARSRLDRRVSGLKASLGELGHNLDKLRQQLRDLEVQAESQMQSRMLLSKEAGTDFDPLEFDRFTRVQELTRMMAESVNDVATVQRHLQRDLAGAEDDLVAQGRQARELQRDLLRTRMVEFDAISERLYAVVRRTSKETGKLVKLDVSGGTIEMDRGVLERMVPAFEHLLRNCVDHGIELPEQRKAAGKSATGTIQVQVQQEGNDVAVTFTDDGAGLHVARIREKALSLGLIAAGDNVDAQRAAQLVFMPGFTTAQQLTGVSGRGIGMDVVRSEVLALGGRIETQSEQGQGSAFRLVLPLTTAVTQAVMLRAGDLTVGVPASLVQVVRRISVADLEAAYRSGELADGEDRMPFFWAGAVWSQSARSVDVGAGKTRPVLICRSASQRVAMHVDEILGHQEVVVKNLGPQMARLPGLTGMSVLASGAVLLLYNPVALAAVYGDRMRQLGQGLPALLDAQTAQQWPQALSPQAPGAGVLPASQVPLVMVVDDSITVRRVSQRLLQREGYRVVTAADGLQALEKLQDELPCVVLSDIEMPRMDGFDLLRNIRSQAPLQHLPVIMITSRIAQKHRDHALELGANHYLGKPYSDEALMGLVHHYALGRPLPQAAEAEVQGMR